MVRQNATKRGGHLVAVRRDVESGPDQVDLGRRLAEGPVLEHMDTGRQGEGRALLAAGSREVDEEQRVAVADEKAFLWENTWARPR